MALAMPSGNVEGNANGDKSRFIEVESMEDGEFRIKFILKNKVDAFWWAVLFVYGATQDEYKEQFLSELV
jgi:hypothetical protein